MADQSLFSLQAVKTFVTNFEAQIPAGATHKGVLIQSDGTRIPVFVGFYVDNHNNDVIYTGNAVVGCPYPPHCATLSGEEKIRCYQDYFEKNGIF